MVETSVWAARIAAAARPHPPPRPPLLQTPREDVELREGEMEPEEREM